MVGAAAQVSSRSALGGCRPRAATALSLHRAPCNVQSNLLLHKYAASVSPPNYFPRSYAVQAMASVLPSPAPSRLVDQMVGTDIPPLTKDNDTIKALTVSFSNLLDPKSWDLPGFTNTKYVWHRIGTTLY